MCRLSSSFWRPCGTANGKLDRAALPAPTLGAAPRASAVAPRTPTEEMVIAAFRGVVDARTSGVRQLLRSGGNSLMAARLVSQLRVQAGVDLPLRNLFERPRSRPWPSLDGLRVAAVPSPGAHDREEIEL